jgi:hypothetical protein
MFKSNHQNRSCNNSNRSRKFAVGRASLALAAALAVAGVMVMPNGSHAATDTWSSTATSSNWNLASNWVGSIPTSTDTAVFNGASNFTAITFGGLGAAQNLNFNGGTSYTIGTTGGPNLSLSAGGYVQMISTDTVTQTVNEPLVLGGNYLFENNSSTSGANLVIGGPISASGSYTLTLGGTNTGIQTISGVISNGTGTVSLNVAGSTWNLSGANTYTGGTTVTSGTLDLTGSLANSGNLTVNGGTFEINNGTGQTIAAFNGTGGTVDLVATGDTLTVNNGGSFSGVITGLGGLTASGSNTLTISGDNTYQDGTTIENGSTINFQNTTSSSSNFGSGASSAVTFGTGGGTLQYGANNITVGNTLDVANAGTIDVNGNTGIWSGQITGAGALTFTTSVVNTGDLFLTNNTNNNSGGDTLENGIIVNFNANNSFGSGTITFGAGGGEIQYSANNLNVGNTLDVANNGIIDAGANTNTETYSGTILDSSGSTLTVQDGTVILTGTNNTGFTAGTLQVGNGTATSEVQFNSIANLPGHTSAGIALDDGTLDYTGTGTASMVTPITLLGTAGSTITTQNNQTIQLDGVAATGQASPLTLSNGTFDLNGTNMNIGLGTLTVASTATVINSNSKNLSSISASAGYINGTIDGQHNAGINLSLGGGNMGSTGLLAGNLALTLYGKFNFGAVSNTYSAGTAIISSTSLVSSGATPPVIAAVPTVATFSNNGDEGGVSSSAFGSGIVQLDNGTLQYSGTGPATLIAGNAIILTDSGNGTTKIGNTTYNWLPSVNTFDGNGQTITIQGAIENAGTNTEQMPQPPVGVTNQTGDIMVFQNGTFDVNSSYNSTDFTTGTIQVGNGLVSNGSGGYAPASSTVLSLDAIGSQAGAGARLALYQGTLQMGVNNLNIAASLESTAYVSSSGYVTPTTNTLDLNGFTATLSGNMATDVESIKNGTNTNAVNIDSGNLIIGSTATNSSGTPIGGGTLIITGDNSAFGDYGYRTVNGKTQFVSDGGVTLQDNITIQLDSNGATYTDNLGAGQINIGSPATGAPADSPGATIQFVGTNEQLGNSVYVPLGSSTFAENALTLDIYGHNGTFGDNGTDNTIVASELTGRNGVLVTNSKTTAGTLFMLGFISTYNGVITIDNALTTLNIVNAVVGSLNSFAFNTGGTLVAGGNYTANNQIIGPITLNDNNVTDIIDANGSVIGDPLGLGGSITNANANTTLLLRNGAFDLTSTNNNNAFSAGKLQIGDGSTTTTTAQFGRGGGVAELPGANVGITLDNGVLSYIGNSPAQMVNAITLTGAGTITANAQTLGLADITGDTVGSAQMLTLQNGTFDLAGSNIGVGELVTSNAAGGGLATITNSSTTTVGDINILPDDMATPTASTIAGNINGGTGAGLVLTLGSGATATTVESSTFSGTLSGKLTLIFTGADGSANLGPNANSFIGSTAVENNAIVQFGNDSSFGAATNGITLNSGTLTYTGTTAAALANTITLTGTGTVIGNAQTIGLTGGVNGTGQFLQFVNGNYDLGGSTLTVGELSLDALSSITNSSTTSISDINILPDSMTTPSASILAGNIDGGSGAGIVLSLGTGAGAATGMTTQFSGNLSGNLALVLNGIDGSANLGAGANTYSNGTTVENNAVALFGNVSSFGTGAITLNQGELIYTGTTAGTLVSAIANAGSSVTNTIDAGGQTLTLSGAITNNTAPGDTLILQDGTIALANTGNTTTFTVGTLQIGNGTGTSVVSASALTDLPGIGAAIVLDQGTLEYSGGGSLTRTVTIANSGGVATTNAIDAGGQALTISAPITNNSTLGDTFALQDGTITLTGTNNTTFTTGIFQIGDGTGTTTVVAATSANLPVTSAGTRVKFAFDQGTLDYSGGGIINNAITVIDNGTVASTGGINAEGTTLTLAGAISTTSTRNDIFSLANGTFVLGGTNNGSTAFTAGYLQIGDGTDTTVVSAAGANNLPARGAGIILDNGTLKQAGSYSVANNIVLGTAGGTLDANGNTGNYTGTIVGQASPTGSLTLTSSSTTAAGTLLLNGVGTFSNNTDITTSGTQLGITVVAGTASSLGSGNLSLTNTSTVANSVNAVETINYFNAVHNITATPSAIALATAQYSQDANSSLGLVIFGEPSTRSYDSVAVAGTSTASLNGNLNLAFETPTGSSFVHPLDFDKYTVISSKTAPTGVAASGGVTPTSTGATPLENGNVTYGTGFRTITVANGGNAYDFYEASVAGTGEVVTVQTLFAPYGQTSNEVAIGSLLDQTFTPDSVVPVSWQSALTAMSAESPSQIAATLGELSPQVYDTMTAESIQNTTFLNQEILGQAQQAFENPGFNTSGLTLLKTSDQDPFSISLDAAMQSAQQEARNSVSYMDSAVVGLPQGYVPPPPVTRSSGFSGFVLGTVTLDQIHPTGGPGEHFSTGGVLGGLDYRLNRNFVVGAFFNWGYTGGTIDSAGSRQQSTSYTPGVFLGFQKSNFYADALASYTYNSYRIDRNVNIGGSASTATGKPTGNQFDAAGMVGYWFPVTAAFKFGPAGGVGYTHLGVSSFSENGSPFDLSVGSQSVNSLRTLLGGQLQWTLFGKQNLVTNVRPALLIINFNAYWQHEFLDNSQNISANFNGLGAGSFAFQSSSPTRDSGLLGGGISGNLSKGVTLFANYELQAGANSQFAQTVMAGVAVSF